MHTDLTDPRTGETFARVPVADAAAVTHAIDAAEAAFADWRETTPAERHELLLALVAAIGERADEIAALEARETGKPLAQVLEDEIPSAQDELRFMAGAARALQTPAAGAYDRDHLSLLLREPLGICAQIAPWNYPFTMAVSKLAPALAMGNTVVLKPAETTPSSALLLGELCAAIFPAGVVTVVCGDRETGRALVADPRPALVSITGSSRAGREVATDAGRDLKHLHLELGGKAAAVVCADADLVRAADGIADAAFYNAGQDCTAACRVLVAAERHDELVALLVERAQAVEVDPLNSREQLRRVAGFVDRLPAHATVRTGGRAQDGPGFFFAPTVVTGVEQQDELVQEEIFGPVVSVQPFADDEQAIALANGVAFGLAASVWTRDHGRALRIPRRLDAGTVWVNAHSAMTSEMPHGGFKASGYGKDLSTLALDSYCRIKHVMSHLD